MAKRVPRPKPRTFPTAATSPTAVELTSIDRGPAEVQRGHIEIEGARTHNLKNVDVSIPRDAFVVVTGVSGSGKSSLAFDTIHAEGRRRFIETLALSSRRWLGFLGRPDVDSIEGLPPTVAIDQRSASPSPRGTVATITEIDDHLRLLFARLGVPHCTKCGREVRSRTPEQIVATVLAMAEGRRVLVLAPLVQSRKGEHAEVFRAIKTAGLLRARVDGKVVEFDDPIPLARAKRHDIDAVVDRLVVREGLGARIAQSLALALQLGKGTVILSAERPESGGWEDTLLSINHACPSCGIGFERLDPSSFNFNHPRGACPGCRGLGFEVLFDESLVLPEHSRSLADGAIAPWRILKPGERDRLLNEPEIAEYVRDRMLSFETPLADWPESALAGLIKGDPEQGYPGILQRLERQFRETKSDRLLIELETYRFERVCRECEGARLKAESRSVTLAGSNLPNLLAKSVPEAHRFVEHIVFQPELKAVGVPLVAAIVERLNFLDRVGLAYLTLDRRSDTLSGGELQRVRLASQLGSGLNGACYILDEPTAGLHPTDTERLLICLRDLRDQGNSLIVVEHDETTMRASDWLIDLGPGAGEQGGRVVAAGKITEIEANPLSATGAYLRRRLHDQPRLETSVRESRGSIAIRGAHARNLQRIDVDIPLGVLTCVTGVSGSGKSTLILDVLAKSARRRIESAKPEPIGCAAMTGLDGFDRLIVIDHAPIGRSSRSTPATYTGALDAIRQVFARTRDAKVRGFGPSRFSFNHRSGRCEACAGQGIHQSPLPFLPDLDTVCEVCKGRRFNPQTLAVTYKSKTIADVLDMKVNEASEFFAAIPRVMSGLTTLKAAGLGYLTLGQSSPELSGGEAQRVKLAAQLGLGSGMPTRTLYILDEPTTGLHFADIANLLEIFARIVDSGNTLIVIEHNLDVMAASDWLIDLGPGGGSEGGKLVAAGTPRNLAERGIGETAKFVKEHLSGSKV